MQIQVCRRSGRRTLTFGNESCMFQVTILTFKNFWGRDCLLWEDTGGALGTFGVVVFCVEENKAWSRNRRASALAGCGNQSKTGGLRSLLEQTEVRRLLEAISGGRKMRVWAVHGERIK